MNIYLTDYRTASTTQTEMMEDVDYPQRVHWFPDTYAKTKTGLVYAPHRIAEKVLDQALVTDLRQRGGKTAFILAAGNSHFAGINPKDPPEGRLTYDYKFMALSLTQVYAGRIAQACGAEDMVITDASACASSLKVMMDVQTLINFYNFDRVIVLSFEDCVSLSVLKFFGEAKACLTKEIEDTGVLPSAFDNTNYGFNIGQGAVFAVFETHKYAKNSKAQLMGAYTAAETSTNAIGQREDGQGFVKAIEGALGVAGMVPRNIQVIKAHGTGTKSNNQSERTAIDQVFDCDVVVTSFKQRIGHTMGASGLLETCLLLDSIQNGLVPKILNKTAKDTRYISDDVFVGDNMNILSLAAGMGNIYSAAIFKTMV